MKILFIGGTGRLSKDVAKLSLHEDNEVFLLTRGSIERKLFIDKKYKMIYADIYNTKDCKEKIKNLHFDVVIDFITFNIKQLINILEVIDGCYDQYIFISTATIYNTDNRHKLIDESTDVYDLQWDYSYNKYECEKYLVEYFENKKEEYTIVRPYVTYGNTRVPYPIVPFSNDKEWTLINRIKEGKPIPVLDNGATKTTITHSEDFAIGVVGLFKNVKAYSEAFHITSDEEVVWGDVIDILAQLSFVESKKVNFTVDEFINKFPDYRDILIGDKGNEARFDNSKIKKTVTNFECRVLLKDGLRGVMEFYKQNPRYQKIDYYWDGKIDKICKSRFNLLKTEKINIKNLINYIRGYFIIIDKAVKFFKLR